MELQQNKLRKFNISTIIIIFLLIQPLIDIMTSLLVRYTTFTLTIGMIIRVAFLVVVCLYCLFNSKSKYKKYIVGYFIVLLTYSLVHLGYDVATKGSTVLFLEIKSLLKSFYFPLLIVALVTIFTDNEKSPSPKRVIIPGVIYCFLIFIAQVMASGFSSYSGLKTGSVGWFYAANEVGTIIAMIFPILAFHVVATFKDANIKMKIVNIMSIILFIYVALSVGTKVPMLGVILTFIALLFIYIIRTIILKDKKRSVVISITSLIMLVLVFIAIPYSASGKNLNADLQHAHIPIKVFDFLQKDDVKQEVAVEPVVEKKLSMDTKDVIYSNRDFLLNSVVSEFEQKPLATKLLGLGYVKIVDDQTTSYTVEMDFHEIFYRFGILGSIVYFIPILLILGSIIILIFSRFRESIGDDTKMSYVVGLLLGLSIAYIAGHVFSAPSVSLYIALFSACLIQLLHNARIKNID